MNVVTDAFTCIGRWDFTANLLFRVVFRVDRVVLESYGGEPIDNCLMNLYRHAVSAVED